MVILQLCPPPADTDANLSPPMTSAGVVCPPRASPTSPPYPLPQQKAVPVVVTPRYARQVCSPPALSAERAISRRDGHGLNRVVDDETTEAVVLPERLVRAVR
jgi:hypothetical protein